MGFHNLEQYELIEERYIADLQSQGILLKHKKTGARVALLSNDDANKVFCIGFKTPPKDSTGVAHITEHSVLCGSAKYPIKDPFVELVKGSMNTFLNAMTYPDKTLYPVASVNDKDFQNIMDVYLDAVFYPRTYSNEKIFRQEGWHYEMSSPEDELKINGVVYNEMKGVFSSPDELLENAQTASLFPDNTYGLNSGGDPDCIPDLTYEDFLAFHKRYYHPSNSYIYLYGNMDMEEKLAYIDREYLSKFEYSAIDSSIPMQECSGEFVRREEQYPIDEDMEEKENGYLSLNYVVGDSLDRELNLAFQILDYAVFSAPGAPVKETLQKKGIGKDVYGEYQNGILQPFFSIVSSNCDVDMEKEFLETIDEVLHQVLKEGIPKNALLAGLNHYEFKYREADFGSYPKGLMYGLQAMDSWLYDDTKPFLHIEANDTFAFLREKIHTDYFEKLLEEYILKNSHKSLVILRPVKNLAQEMEQKQKAALQAKKDAMSAEEIQKIIADYEALTAYQEAEDSKEDLAKIPMLTRKDLSKEARKILLEKRTIDDTTVLTHIIYTNGIAYLRWIFHLNHIPERLFGALSVLKTILGLMDTENYKYGDLFHQINLETGGMSPIVNVYRKNDCDITLEYKAKVFYAQIPKAFEILQEIIFTTQYDREERLYDLLQEAESKMQSQMISAGHSVAINRAFSYVNASGQYNEILGGIPYYRRLQTLVKEFDVHKNQLIADLKELCQLIFINKYFEMDYIGEEKGYELLTTQLKQFVKQLPDCPEGFAEEHFVPEVAKKNEGFMTSGQVQYVSMVGDFKKENLPYHGSLRCLKVMMEYNYLWENIRVKGGAYGCMCGFGRSGETYFVSYRDPHLKNTLRIYQDAVKAIESFDADERTLDQLIIGAVSDMDNPITPAAYGLFSMVSYRNGITQEELDRDRIQLLNTTVEDIRGLAKYIEVVLKQNNLCVVGAKQKITDAKKIFMNTESLV